MASRLVVAGSTALLLGCGSPPHPAGEASAPAGEYPGSGCTCDQLRAPLQLPGDATTWARWRSTAIEIDRLFEQLASLIPPDAQCAATLDADFTRALEDHAQAVREAKQLDDLSCDHFARWRMQRTEAAASNEQMIRVTDVLRGCELLRTATAHRLSALVITRWCTEVE